MAKLLKQRLQQKLEDKMAEDGSPDPMELLEGKRKKSKKDHHVDNARIIEEFKAFLVIVEGSPLRAWRIYFDADGDGRINEFQFVRAVRNLKYSGDPTLLFRALDDDASGELALEEIDGGQSTLWVMWCEWCAQKFNSSAHMVQTLHWSGNTLIAEKDFLDGLERLEWPHGQEALLFRALDVNNNYQLSASEMKFLDFEKLKQRRKHAAKDKAKRDRKRQIYSPQEVKKSFDKFKRHLKNTYGSYIRAWRIAVSPNDSVSCSRSQFMMACTQLGFKNVSRVLWRAFGKDDSSSISIDFLDAESAEMLAHFQALVKRLGGVRAAFRALDKRDVKRIKLPEFAAALKELNPDLPAKALFNALDKDCSHRLEEDDIYFLDSWKLPDFLTATAKTEARDDVKELMLHQFGNFLKAWRLCLDTDNSNRCSWPEFQQACRRIGYQGDVPGAWRALDEDLSESISLEEIDPASSQILTNYKEWADDEFGGVRSAFSVFDSDGSNSLTLKEWRHACRVYGFVGNSKNLFSALDVEGNGSLSLDEIGFLDEWDFPRAKGSCDFLPEDDDDSPKKKKTNPKPQPSYQAVVDGAKRAAAKRVPRVVGLAERSWWHELPCKQPFPKAKGPGTGLPVAWCSLCKSRGPCRHFARMAAPQRGEGSGLKSTYDSLISPPDESELLLARLGRSRRWPGTDSPNQSARMGSLKDELRLSVRASTAPWSTRVRGQGSDFNDMASFSARAHDSFDNFQGSLEWSEEPFPWQPRRGAEVQHMALKAYPIGTAGPLHSAR